MNTADQSVSFQAEVGAIWSDCDRALRTLKRWSDHPGAPGTPKVRGRSFSKTDASKFKRLIEAHRRVLLRVVRASSGGELKQRVMARQLVLRSLAAHVCAVMRSLVRNGRYASPDEIMAMAIESKHCRPLPEPVSAWWKQKDKGGYRLMCKDGVARTAQRLVYRDMLSVLNIDSEFDYSRRGKGEKALLTQVCKLMDDEEYHWWSTPDIKSYFASLKPCHFGWLPLTRHEIKNIVFYPKCAKVQVRLPKPMGKVIHGLKMQYPAFLMIGIMDMVSLTTQLVRQGGLPQGAVHSPLLARGFVGRELRNLFGAEEGIVGLSWVDDLIIGARLKKDAQAAVHALTERFKTHPAGPLELHASKPLLAASWKVQVLGYFLEPGNGYGDNPIHVKPGPKRFGKFRRELAKRLKAAGPQDDLYQIADDYWKHWYQAQQAWTKVPLLTAMLSQNITGSYVDDFKGGIQMGKNWTPKAKSAGP